jgi:pseudouridine kinase
MRITVIGESNIDISVVPQSAPSQGGCTPAKINFHHGGVARNIAHNLSLLGHHVQLATVFGDDDFAQSMMAECQHLGIDLSLSSQFKGEKSPIFLSFNDETGNMQSAVSDVGLNECMDLDWLKGKMNAIIHSDLVVADTLLSTEALTYLIDHCKVPLFIDTVSPVKALQFAEALKQSKKHSLFALKCNFAEAISITGNDDVFESAKKLNVKGISQVYITVGAKGVIHCTKGITTSYPALPTQIANVTGSGDAFFSGVIHAHAIGLGEKAIQFGLKMAQHNIKSEAPVNPTLRISVFDE